MCGIIGYVGAQGIDVTTLLLDGLSKLEYRGYDSAGIAVLTSTGNLELRRRAGKIANLVATVENGPHPDEGTLGIGLFKATDINRGAESPDPPGSR